MSPADQVRTIREIFQQGDLARLARMVERAGQDATHWALMLNAAESLEWVDWVCDQAVAAGAWSQGLDDARRVRLADFSGEPPF